MKYIEIERKFQLTDVSMLRNRLCELGAEMRRVDHQIDTYYNAPHRDFLASPIVSEWLRVRISGHSASMNFKRWRPIGEVEQTHCDEYETAVSDLEAVRRMLDALGFSEMVTVDKKREEWVPEDLVIAVDEVADLGAFVEFEYHGTAADVERASAELANRISEIGVPLGERDRRGYPYQLLNRDR